MRRSSDLPTKLTNLSARLRSPVAAVCGVTLAALVLRLLRLGFQPLWWDEGWSLYFATTDVPELIRSTAVDIHPPLYYLLLRSWTALFGATPHAVRLLSVFIGTVSIPLLYHIGRRLLGHRAGLLAAALLAFSPFHIYYSQEVRMYGLVTILGLAAFWFSLGLAGQRLRIIPWLGYVLSATAALYTQYYAAFLLLALTPVLLVHWLWVRRSWRGAAAWLSAQFAVLVLFVPWVGYAAGKLATYVRFKVSIEDDLPLNLLAYLGRHLAAFSWGHAEGALGGWWWIGLLPLLLLVVGLALVLGGRSRRKEPQGSSFTERSEEGARSPVSVAGRYGAWAILVIVLACGYAVNRALTFNPPRLERLLLLALPFFLLLFADGLCLVGGARVRRRAAVLLPAAALVILGAVSLAAFYTVPRYPDDDYRALAEDLWPGALPTDVIVCVHPWQVGYFQSYLPQDVRPILFLTPREVLPRERQLWADAPEQMAAALESLLAEHGRVWVPAHEAMGRVLESQIEAYLADSAYPVQTQWYGPNTVLSLFASGERPGLSQPLTVTAMFADWLSLDRAALNSEPLQAGWGVVTAELAWQVLRRPDERYQVGLRLADASGRVWAQRDSYPRAGQEHFFDWPVGQTRVDRHGLLVPAGTPPGEYQVTARVYRTQDLAVAPASFSGGSGAEVPLGTVRVVRPQKPPPVEALHLQHSQEVTFADRLQLLGFSLDNGTILLPGETLEVYLFWRALAAPGEDYLPRLQLIGDGGQIVAERTEKPVAGTYPTAWWQPGELVRDPHELPIPATVQAGTYQLGLSLVRATDGALQEAKPRHEIVVLSQTEIGERAHDYGQPVPDHTQRIGFGSSVELVGYDLREVVRAPGSPLQITLHWHALETPDRSYHAFVHLLSGEGEQALIVAQHDGLPGNGQAPPLGWLPGEYVSDTHMLQLPFDLPDGTYYLGVGLYDPAADRRLGERTLLETTIPVAGIEGCRCP